ncbi:leucine-rich repeat domain-containing protein [Akkermansiaceae bacterium]|nr:leucine-rich repeat domain-containing protein [Akkermansiaceae bacterium]
MKHLISLLAFSFLIGCDGEKGNVAPSKDSSEVTATEAPSKDSPEEAASEAPSEGSLKETASEAKPPEAVSVNPNLKYEIKGDAVTITGCDKKASEELIIPAMIEGKPVTSIGDEAFKDCKSLTNITIGNGVTSVGGVAFFKCRKLTSITIPDSVTSIGDWAFYQCTNLSAATFLGDAPKIEDKAFEDSSPTIYREADAKGWSDTLAGRPVKLITEKP